MAQWRKFHFGGMLKDRKGLSKVCPKQFSLLPAPKALLPDSLPVPSLISLFVKEQQKQCFLGLKKNE